MLPPGHSHRFPAYAWRDLDCPHRPTLVFPAHFVLTHTHLGATSQSVTHPQIDPSQARLTLEFFEDVLPEKKVHLVDMSSLSFLLSQDVTVLVPGPKDRHYNWQLSQPAKQVEKHKVPTITNHLVVPWKEHVLMYYQTLFYIECYKTIPA